MSTPHRLNVTENNIFIQSSLSLTHTHPHTVLSACPQIYTDILTKCRKVTYKNIFQPTGHNASVWTYDNSAFCLAEYIVLIMCPQVDLNYAKKTREGYAFVM